MFYEGVPIKNCWASGHFQMVIIVDTIIGQYKMQIPTWSSPSQSSRTTSYELHATTQPLQGKPQHCLQDHIQLLATQTNVFPLYLNFSLSHHGHALHHHSYMHLVIILLISFKIFLAINLFIAFYNILFTSFLTHGIKPRLPNGPFHTIFRYINHFTM